MRICFFEIPKNFDWKALIETLSESYSVRCDPIESDPIQKKETEYQRTFYDTFDQRLFDKSLQLFTQEKHLILASLHNDDEAINRLKMGSSPRFIADFPKSSLTARLSPIVEMRALLPIATVHLQTHSILISDETDRPIARLDLEGLTAYAPGGKEGKQGERLKLCVQKNRTKSGKKLLKFLKKNGYRVSSESLFESTMGLIGSQPANYSAKLQLTLHPEIVTYSAMKVIFRFLLKVIRENEEGVKQDIDTEFLHDFRVAIRRTRAGLNQIASAFPDEILDKFKKDFSFLGKMTNELRDLDVYLLNRDAYRSPLPDFFKKSIDPLFDFLRREREEVLQKVRVGLGSERYAQILSEWEEFLNRPLSDAEFGVDGGEPAQEIAKKIIYNRYKVIIKRGKRINRQTEDNALHQLRIDCKKLRYLLEFFVSLFPKQKTKALIKQLKKLQDNLGEFQDLCVHQDALQSFVEKFPLQDHKSKRTIMAIGCLIGIFDRRKGEVRRAFSETFSGFASKKNRALFRELFA